MATPAFSLRIAVTLKLNQATTLAPMRIRAYRHALAAHERTKVTMPLSWACARVGTVAGACVGRLLLQAFVLLQKLVFFVSAVCAPPHAHFVCSPHTTVATHCFACLRLWHVYNVTLIKRQKSRATSTHPVGISVHCPTARVRQRLRCPPQRSLA